MPRFDPNQPLYQWKQGSLDGTQLVRVNAYTDRAVAIIYTDDDGVWCVRRFRPYGIDVYPTGQDARQAVEELYP